MEVDYVGYDAIVGLHCKESLTVNPLLTYSGNSLVKKSMEMARCLDMKE